MAAQKEMDKQCISTIRTLAMDAVQQANSGHPGTPMAEGVEIFEVAFDKLLDAVEKAR